MTNEFDSEQLRLTRVHLARIVAGTPNCPAAPAPELLARIRGSARYWARLYVVPSSSRQGAIAQRNGDEPPAPDGPEPESAPASGPRPSSPPGGAQACAPVDSLQEARCASEVTCTAGLSA